MKRVGAYVLAICAATLALAEAPEQSPRPTSRVIATNAPPEVTLDIVRPALRPDSVAAYAPQIALPDVQDRPRLRPYLRPDLERGAETRPQRRAEQNLFAFSPYAISSSLVPTLRPPAIPQRFEQQRQARLRGQVCGDPDIQGTDVGRVEGRGRCGIDSAVRIKSVAGVRLSTQALMDCTTARALKRWIETGARPAVANIGGGIRSLRVVAHYACRFRNSASSGRLSEHSFGHAIDIAGIGLQNGDEITLLTDWGGGEKGRALRQMWRAACGPFGTVLGPESNRFHRDHFHFDTARYRSGSFCR
ncbi:Uncharacterized conserved protein [Cognatiyoonia sediminum]|uniref:Uncharacterized conserved protein n=1 Tax=Cognatiyoonia sediminum TaxID=1508389 RepID=A0A1M5NGJ4_9RHOB|nr:extensin family protein [Cognatiyoonia sediminum]SHG88093.1 Uncharacterized conserved protein [Cognatiyoonia sediminum]